VSLRAQRKQSVVRGPERSEFLDSAEDGESNHTLQAPPQRVCELGERESANAIAPGVGVLPAFFQQEA